MHAVEAGCNYTQKLCIRRCHHGMSRDRQGENAFPTYHGPWSAIFLAFNKLQNIPQQWRQVAYPHSRAALAEKRCYCPLDSLSQRLGVVLYFSRTFFPFSVGVVL